MPSWRGSLLAVITDDEFDDDAVVARRASIMPSWTRSWSTTSSRRTPS